ncbi:MAG: HDOD domain-containing protein [Spartobacteria bacterium]|nr:HDOD domain-containing protein [Spartobacteria bacterium]
MKVRENIIRQIEKADNLPTLPGILTELMKVVDDPNSSARKIANVIEHDPALTARILKVANSAAFGSINTVASVAQASARLGIKQVRDISMTLSVIDLLDGSRQIDYTRYWKHCLSVAFAAQIMAKRARRFSGQLDDIFTAGMLHDLGILILDQFVEDSYKQVIALAQDKMRETYLVEREVMGIDHAEAGGLVLRKWRLPQPIIDAATYHHVPCECPEETRLVTQLIHLANFACNNQGIDSGMDIFPTTFSESSWFDTGLSVDDIPAIIEEVNQETAKSTVLVAAAQK